MKAISKVLLLVSWFGFGLAFAQQGRPPGGPPLGGPPSGGPPEGRPDRGGRPPGGPGGGGGPRPENLGETPADLGSAGIVWYPILEDGLAEAKRTNKPILFMAVASQCGGISGVFCPGYTATQNREFSEKNVIEATRDFVCIRIDSYESEEAQKLVRSYLNGRFANTAFCILSPDGKERLTRSGRGPHHAIRGDLAEGLTEISKRYREKGKAEEAAVPDFPNFRLGLNVASADQRLMVLVSGGEEELAKSKKALRALSNDEEIVGKFHYDFESDSKSWKKILDGETVDKGLMIVLPDEYGQKGKVMKSLSFEATVAEVKAALLEANETFAKETEKKVYRDHVREGRRNNIEWTMPMEYGEDRDGDGKIDFRGGGRRRQ